MNEQVRRLHGHGPEDEMRHTHFFVEGDGHDHATDGRGRPAKPTGERTRRKLRQADVITEVELRREAAELEARAFRLGQTIATTQAEQMSLFARAAVLRARAEEA